MTKRLHIARGFSLPLDTVTQTFGILARKRAGKSYTARRLAEQMFLADLQIVVVDPKGDWWGMRSAADGKAPGLPILILGGEHGDVPLEVHGGELVAKLVVEERVSVLLDLSLFRKHEVATFMTAFAEALYRLKAREQYRSPVMLIIDEADAVAPQKPQHGEERMLGAIEDIVRRGGQRGIGCGLITQRSAVLNKNVLTQIQILITLQTIAPQDLKAMQAWVDVHGTAEQRKVLMESLPSLPRGDAWFWSPGWPTNEGIFQRVHVLPIETFDSGATPKAGEKRVEPKKRADVDVEALRRQMAETLERVKASDPRELQKRVRELEAELKKARAEKVPAAKVEIREVPVIKESQLKRLEALGERAGKGAEAFAAAVRELHQVAAPALQPVAAATRPPPPRAPAPRPPAPVRPAPRAHHEAQPESNGAIKLNRGAREMLTSLLSLEPLGLSRQQLGVHAVLGYRTGTFSDYLSALRRSGFIRDEAGGRIVLTAEGTAAAPRRPPRSPAELQAAWGAKMYGGARRMLDALIQAHGAPLTREQLGELSQLGPNTGTFSDYLSLLRRNGLIEEVGRGEVKASDALFLGGG